MRVIDYWQHGVAMYSNGEITRCRNGDGKIDGEFKSDLLGEIL